MTSLWLLHLFLIGREVVYAASGTDKIRLITWNVDDNSRMGGSFTDNAIDRVLGLDRQSSANRQPSMYAIGLQENCWMCNRKNLRKLAHRFLSRINERVKSRETGYEIVGVQATRNSSRCEFMCYSLGTHGTTALIVIATKLYFVSHRGFWFYFYPFLFFSSISSYRYPELSRV